LQGSQVAGQGGEPVLEAAVGADQLVANLAQGGTQVLAVPPVNFLKQRVEAFELADDEAQIVVDFVGGLGRGEAALGG
jgi:hypothetical protein